jgi:hypothetical protein
MLKKGDRTGNIPEAVLTEVFNFICGKGPFALFGGPIHTHPSYSESDR